MVSERNTVNESGSCEMTVAGLIGERVICGLVEREGCVALRRGLSRHSAVRRYNLVKPTSTHQRRAEGIGLCASREGLWREVPMSNG